MRFLEYSLEFVIVSIMAVVTYRRRRGGWYVFAIILGFWLASLLFISGFLIVLFGKESLNTSTTARIMAMSIPILDITRWLYAQYYWQTYKILPITLQKLRYKVQ